MSLELFKLQHAPTKNYRQFHAAPLLPYPDQRLRNVALRHRQNLTKGKIKENAP
jgi:hypothetical protein